MPRSPEPARQALITAAERLFAQHGIDAVPVGDVVRAAGQRNHSAVQYHFGSRLGLVRAVVDKHQIVIDAHRVAMLDRLDGKADPTLRDIIEVLVQPLAALLEHPAGRDFLQIQASLQTSRELGGEWTDRPGAARMIERLAQLSVALRDPRHDHRRALVITLLFHGLADFTRRRPDADELERDRFTIALIDSLVAVITARPSL